MIPVPGRLRCLLFGIAPGEVTFARRGFRETDPARRERLEHVGRVFLIGYQTALWDPCPAALGPALDTVALEVRGFAFEGAAMALSLLDRLTPWNRGRWRALLEGPGAPHAYLVHVGLGWTLARLCRRVEPALRRLDPVLGWLAVDGYGFHEGYFRWRRYVEARAEPARLSGYARRAFDQGLGRSLWFVEGADVRRIARTIGAFVPARQADLWSGVGLACGYAGSVEGRALHALRGASGTFRPALAQGVAFAAKARLGAGNLVPHTELACRILCGVPAEEAAAVTDAARANLAPDGEDPAFEVWRRRIQARFGGGAAP